MEVEVGIDGFSSVIGKFSAQNLEILLFFLHFY